MKKAFTVMVSVAALVCLIHESANAQDRRLKVEDKSSPVWQALEAYYAKADEAILKGDLNTTLKLREIVTIQTPDGRIRGSQEVAESTKAQFKLNQKVLKVSNTIIGLTAEGDEAIAVVLQEFSRMQDLAGQPRRVDSSIIQTEIFVKTPEGWKVRYIVIPGHQQKRYVDGKRVNPNKPYDPHDPPYNPDTN